MCKKLRLEKIIANIELIQKKQFKFSFLCTLLYWVNAIKEFKRNQYLRSKLITKIRIAKTLRSSLKFQYFTKVSLNYQF